METRAKELHVYPTGVIHLINSINHLNFQHFKLFQFGLFFHLYGRISNTGYILVALLLIFNAFDKKSKEKLQVNQGNCNDTYATCCSSGLLTAAAAWFCADWTITL